MRVFISWSGERSGPIAVALASFVEYVTGLRTFVSSVDIATGMRWEDEISKELESTHYAILCVTPENQQRPWLNFEAGALSKHIAISQVVPYTLGFSPAELLPGPLTRFQGVQNSREGTLRMILDLSKTIDPPKSESFVTKAFEKWWPELQTEMTEVLSRDPNAVKENAPTERALLIEMRQSIARIMEHTVDLSRVDSDSAIKAIYSASYDHLTGLLNRRGFASAVHKLAEAKRSFVIAIMDVDHFKAINDNFGHAVGDEVLQKIVEHLTKSLPHDAIISRHGGEEFCAALVDMSSDQVAVLLSNAIKTLAAYIDDPRFPALSFSAGVSSTRSAGTREQMVSADSGLYEAKKAGRAQVVIADSRP